MRSPGIQISVSGLLTLVVCAALNLWLFRVSWLYGLIGLNVTKHVAVAVLCAAIGVNGRRGGQHVPGDRPTSAIPRPHAVGGVPGS